MKSSIPKLGIILIAVIVFPTLFFSAYEINNISKNERVVDSIYSSQLASIVFSLNQYSDDVMSHWTTQFDYSPIWNNLPKDSVVNYFFNWYPSVQEVFFCNKTKLLSRYTNKEQWPDYSLSSSLIEEKLQTNELALEKILAYFTKDYKKILPINLAVDNTSLIVFVLHNNDYVVSFCGVVFESEQFVKDKLGPKIQAMAQDKFVVSVFNTLNGQELYSNDFNDEEEHRMRIKDDLWLLENCQVGIYLIGDPIEKMVQKRTRTNIIMIVLMDVILLLGAWFVYRNVRQELKLAQIKSEFVSNVSHEIKTPLAIINMYSETLDLGRVKSEEKKSEYYKVINKEAKRLSSMVNKILNFSKIDNGRRAYHFIDTDVNELVQQICTNYQHHFNHSGFKCEVDMIDELPLIKADEEALTDAVNNLIDNAIKYSQDIKEIQISTGIMNQRVFVSVKDSGIGMHEKEQRLIFDKFYRVTDGNLAHKAKGSGIGLNIVKHIVESHQGEIQLTSIYGKGSQFTLFFPIKNDSYEHI